MKVNEKDMRRKVAASVMRDIRRKRAAQKERERKTKYKEDLFEQVKVKMVMSIYGVSSEQAKEIIAGRVAERETIEAENRSKREKRVRNFRHPDYDDYDDDEWIPASEIFSDARE